MFPKSFPIFAPHDSLTPFIANRALLGYSRGVGVQLGKGCAHV
jgi:hypothetical protein